MNDNGESYRDAPFQYSIAISMMDAVEVGVRLGWKCAFDLAILYGIALPIFLLSAGLPPSPDSLHGLPTVADSILGIYVASALLSIVIILIGLLPALLIGYTSGWLIGKLFQDWLSAPLPPRRAVLLGFWLSGGLLVLRLGFVALLSGSLYNEFWGIWAAWYLPNLVAFFGLWWVVCRLNHDMGGYEEQPV